MNCYEFWVEIDGFCLADIDNYRPPHFADNRYFTCTETEYMSTKYPIMKFDVANTSLRLLDSWHDEGL